jgi:uncharacterized protein (TIGR04255 family)
MTLIKLNKPKKTETPELPNSPLLETIFELRWEIEADQQAQRMRDPSYPMMYGRIYEHLRKELPFIEDLPTTQAHPDTTPFVPRHRMRKDANAYPLVQMGPGILTINHAKGYSWSQFEALIKKTVGLIIELFPKEKMALNFVKAELRYVNGIHFDMAKENALAFLHEKLHIHVEPDPEILSRNGLDERPNNVGMNLSYVLSKPAGFLGFSANLGQVEGKPAYVLQTAVQSFGEVTPNDAEQFATWLEGAHEAAENCFQVFCKGTLMSQFSGNR